jgi:hypothetical protein
VQSETPERVSVASTPPKIEMTGSSTRTDRNFMAQKVQLILTDDIDGSSAAETVLFGIDGVTYEIDLTSEHAAELRDALTKYIEHGRKVGTPARGRAAGRGARATGRDYVPAAVREWAASQGIDVPARGRIPGEVLDRYRASR